jgi:hypothetical protein
MLVLYKVDIIVISLKWNFFSPWYIAEKLLIWRKIQHSLSWL